MTVLAVAFVSIGLGSTGVATTMDPEELARAIDGIAGTEGAGPSFVEGSPEAMAIDAAWTPAWEETPSDSMLDVTIVDLAEARAALQCADELLAAPGFVTCTGMDGVVRTLLDSGEMGSAHEDVPPEEDPLRTSATRSVRCVGDPTVSKHWRAVYAYPSDKTSRYSTVVEGLRTHMREANYILNAKAQIFGYTMDYIYRCSSGTLNVASVQLPIAASAGTHGNIKTALANKGYNSNLAKYVVYWDSSSTYCYGDIYNDASASSSNSNNAGPRYSTMGTGGWTEYCSIHETMHNSGAVLLSAPFADGGYHCTDGTDWMCYSQYNNARCTTGRILDCYADSYCNPNPPSSNWLYTHWNNCHARHAFFYKAAG